MTTAVAPHAADEPSDDDLLAGIRSVLQTFDPWPILTLADLDRRAVQLAEQDVVRRAQVWADTRRWSLDRDEMRAATQGLLDAVDRLERLRAYGVSVDTNDGSTSAQRVHGGRAAPDSGNTQPTNDTDGAGADE